MINLSIKKYHYNLSLIFLLIASQGVGAAIIYENTESAAFYANTGPGANLSNISTPNVSGTITEIVIKAKSAPNQAGTSIQLNVCNPVYDQQNQTWVTANCVLFSQGASINSQLGDISFSNINGFQVTANSPFMITFTNPDGNISIKMATAQSLYSCYSPCSVGYSALNANYKEVYTVISGVVPESVPTLSDLAKFLLMISLVGIMGWGYKQSIDSGR
jgi:hypothetical protein